MPELTTIDGESFRRLVQDIRQLKAQVAVLTGDVRRADTGGPEPTWYFVTCHGDIEARDDDEFKTGNANLTPYDTGVEDFRETSLSPVVTNPLYYHHHKDSLAIASRDGYGKHWILPMMTPIVRVRIAGDRGDVLEPGGMARAAILDTDGHNSGFFIDIHDFMLLKGETVENAIEGVAVLIENKWWLISAQCPD